jgi:hypothetical protein
MEDSNEIHDNGGSSPLSSPVDEGREPILASPTASSPINTTAAISSQSPTNPGTSTMAKRKAKPKKKVVVHRAPKKSKWNAENILTDPKSPLATADLRVRERRRFYAATAAANHFFTICSSSDSPFYSFVEYSLKSSSLGCPGCC